MFDAYAAAREAAAGLLRRAGFPQARAADVRACTAGYALSSALARRLGLAPGDCLLAARAAEAEAPALLCGAPAFREIALRGGHLCFALTDAAYGALMRSVIRSAPLPPLPAETERPLAYAAARMRMLARTESTGCPDSPAVRRALWLCFGIAECGLPPKQRDARAERAAHAVLTMGQAMPLRARTRLYSACGDVGKCAARLLGYALAAETSDFIES